MKDNDKLSSESKRLVITVLVSDRVGILRDICSAVTGLNGNIDGISQTVVEGYFTVILTASFKESVTPDRVQDAILAGFAPGEANVSIRPYQRRTGGKPTVSGERFIVSLQGRDRPGILKTVLSFLAERGVNVEDWFVVFEGSQVTHIGDVTVPLQMDIKQLQNELSHRVDGLGLSAGIQHENIFRATNDVGPVSGLLEKLP